MEITFEGGKVVTASHNGHIIKTDQPLDNGGGDTARKNTETLLLMSQGYVL